MFKLLVFVFAISSYAQANNHVGFSKGNALSATPIQGQVRVVCNGFNGTGSAIYMCRDLALNPSSYDYFVGPRDARATKVELTATHQDGSTRSKTTDYKGAEGRSSESINLWISTLFQKPLLEAGTNSIKYRLLTRDTVYAEGTYQATVTKKPLRECAPATYNSSDINDCNSQYSICQAYFREHNYCQ